jgi:hypothetical protein
MHAVSLTPHAPSKILNNIEKGFVMQKKIKCSFIDTACTSFASKNRAYLGEFEEELKKAFSP